jgi:aspartate ammonia-lyase
MNELTKEERIIAALESFTQGGQGTMFNFNAESFIHNYGLSTMGVTESEVNEVYKKWERKREKEIKRQRKLFAC